MWFPPRSLRWTENKLQIHSITNEIKNVFSCRASLRLSNQRQKALKSQKKISSTTTHPPSLLNSYRKWREWEDEFIHLSPIHLICRESPHIIWYYSSNCLGFSWPAFKARFCLFHRSLWQHCRTSTLLHSSIGLWYFTINLDYINCKICKSTKAEEAFSLKLFVCIEKKFRVPSI